MAENGAVATSMTTIDGHNMVADRMPPHTESGTVHEGTAHHVACFQTGSYFLLAPPMTRAWGPRGHALDYMEGLCRPSGTPSGFGSTAEVSGPLALTASVANEPKAPLY